MIKNFFNISDLSREQIFEIINLDINEKSLENYTIGLLFEKYSTRTRLSFSVGIHQLGGNAIDIRFQDLNYSRDESFEDTFLAFNCYLDGLIFRTEDHNKLINCEKYFKKPVINGLSNISHPCQILSDLYTLKNHFHDLKINILWIGDLNNVCFSLLEASNIIKELNLTICSAKQLIETNEWISKFDVNVIHKINEIDLSSLHCVMTDVYISMNDKNEISKEKLLKPYSVTNELMNKTSKDCIFMHCLPAKVGSEVDEEVIKGKKSIVWKQAFNRLVAQKKLLQYINWE